MCLRFAFYGTEFYATDGIDESQAHQLHKRSNEIETLVKRSNEIECSQAI